MSSRSLVVISSSAAADVLLALFFSSRRCILVLIRQEVPVGAAAAGGRAIDARRLMRGVAGTRIRPRSGRSRSNVTRRMSVTSNEAITTLTTPRWLRPK